MRLIEVVPYQSCWPKQFEEERELIRSSIPVELTEIHHIGSTSVKGLAAKPIIDILIEIDNVKKLDTCSESFEKIGYKCKGEFGIPGRRYFQKGRDNRTHQIHAFNAGSYGAMRHLAFRDYLIANEVIAREYEMVKHHAVKNCANSIALYCDYKKEFVTKYENLAIKWYQHA